MESEGFRPVCEGDICNNKHELFKRITQVVMRKEGVCGRAVMMCSQGPKKGEISITKMEKCPKKARNAVGVFIASTFESES